MQETEFLFSPFPPSFSLRFQGRRGSEGKCLDFLMCRGFSQKGIVFAQLNSYHFLLTTLWIKAVVTLEFKRWKQYHGKRKHHVDP